LGFPFLEAELVLAIEREEFELFYQPQVNLLDGRLIGAEALIRWHYPTRGLVPPGAFIPLVNTSTISDAVADWALTTASRQARRWELAGHRVQVGINLSKKDFTITSGTLFASHKLPLRCYLAAIAIFCNEVKAKSALAISRDLCGSYKCAFVLLHKLREAMAEEMKSRVVGKARLRRLMAAISAAM
jgi:predicted signal transduction protein with EAL and GGDEF domain